MVGSGFVWQEIEENNKQGRMLGSWLTFSMLPSLPFPFVVENEDDEVVAGKIVNHTISFIDDRYRTRSYIEGRMVQIMERCWVYDMDKRADIFEVVDLLRQVVRDSEQKQSEKNT